MATPEEQLAADQNARFYLDSLRGMQPAPPGSLATVVGAPDPYGMATVPTATNFDTYLKQYAQDIGVDPRTFIGVTEGENAPLWMQAVTNYRDTVLPYEISRMMGPRTPQSAVKYAINERQMKFDTLLPGQIERLRAAFGGVPGAGTAAQEGSPGFLDRAGAAVQDILTSGAAGAVAAFPALAQLAGTTAGAVVKGAGEFLDSPSTTEYGQRMMEEINRTVSPVTNSILRFGRELGSDLGKQEQLKYAAYKQTDEYKNADEVGKAALAVKFAAANPNAFVSVIGESVGGALGPSAGLKLIQGAGKAFATKGAQEIGERTLINAFSKNPAMQERLTQAGTAAGFSAQELGTIQAAAYEEAIRAGDSPEMATRRVNEILSDPAVLLTSALAAATGVEMTRLAQGIPARAARGSAAGDILRKTATETVTEPGQEVAQTRAQNIAFGEPEWKGTGEAAGIAMLAGGGTGAAGATLDRLTSLPAKAPPPTTTPPPAAGAPAGEATPTQPTAPTGGATQPTTPTGEATSPAAAGAGLEKAAYSEMLDTVTSRYQSYKEEKLPGTEKLASGENTADAVLARLNDIEAQVRNDGAVGDLEGWESASPAQQQEYLRELFLRWGQDRKVDPKQLDVAMQQWGSKFAPPTATPAEQQNLTDTLAELGGQPVTSAPAPAPSGAPAPVAASAPVPEAAPAIPVEPLETIQIRREITEAPAGTAILDNILTARGWKPAQVRRLSLESKKQTILDEGVPTQQEMDAARRAVPLYPESATPKAPVQATDADILDRLRSRMEQEQIARSNANRVQGEAPRLPAPVNPLMVSTQGTTAPSAADVLRADRESRSEQAGARGAEQRRQRVEDQLQATELLAQQAFENQKAAEQGARRKADKLISDGARKRMRTALTAAEKMVAGNKLMSGTTMLDKLEAELDKINEIIIAVPEAVSEAEVTRLRDLTTALKKKVKLTAAVDGNKKYVRPEGAQSKQLLSPWDFTLAKDGASLLRRYLQLGKNGPLKALASILLQSPRMREVRVEFVDTISLRSMPTDVQERFARGETLALATADSTEVVLYFRKDVPLAFTEDAVVHEAMHALTLNAIHSSPAARRELTTLAKTITRGLNTLAARGQIPQTYVLFWNNVTTELADEVLTYALTDPEFASVLNLFAADGQLIEDVDLRSSPNLRQGPAPGAAPVAPTAPTVWQRIVDFVRKIFRVPTAQAKFEQALDEYLLQQAAYGKAGRDYESVRTLESRLSGMLADLIKYSNTAGIQLRWGNIAAQVQENKPNSAEQELMESISKRISKRIEDSERASSKRVGSPTKWFTKHFVEKRVSVRDLMYAVVKKLGELPADLNLYDALVRSDSRSSLNIRQAKQDILEPLGKKIGDIYAEFRDRMTSDVFLASIDEMFSMLHGIERNVALLHEDGKINELGGRTRARLMRAVQEGRLAYDKYRQQMAANYRLNGLESLDDFRAAGEFTNAEMQARLAVMASQGFTLELAERLRPELDRAREFIIAQAQRDGSFTPEHQNLLRARGWQYYFPLKTKKPVAADPLARSDKGQSRHLSSIHQELEGRRTDSERPLAQLLSDVLVSSTAAEQNEVARTLFRFVNKYNKKMNMKVKITAYTNTLDRGLRDSKDKELTLTEALDKNSVIYKTGDTYFVMKFPEGSDLMEGMKAVTATWSMLDRSLEIPVWFNGATFETPTLAELSNVRARSLTNWFPLWTLTKEFVRTFQTYGAFMFQEFGLAGAFHYIGQVLSTGGWAQYARVVFDKDGQRSVSDIRAMAAAGDQIAAEIVDLMDNGGFAEFAQRLNPERITSDIAQDLKRMNSNMLIKGARKFGHKWVEVMDGISTMVDLSTRLAAYKTAYKFNGGNAPKAAAYAKKLFDFQQGGLNSGTLNVFFTFFRSSLTSLDRQWNGFKNERGEFDWKDPRVRRGLVALSTMGVVWYYLLMGLFSMFGYDDDEIEEVFKKLDDDTFANNLVLPNPWNKMEPIIQPLGYQLPQVVFGLGTLTARMAEGHTSPRSWFNSAASTIMRNATPLNVTTDPSDGFWDFAKGTFEAGMRATIAGPVVETYMNENSFGDPIARQPGEGAFRSESGKFNTLDTYKDTARAMRQWFGFDIQPEMLEHLISGYFGSLGTEPIKVFDMVAYQNPNPEDPYPLLPRVTTRDVEFYEMRALEAAKRDLSETKKEYNAIAVRSGEAVANVKFGMNPSNKARLELLERIQSVDTKQRKEIAAIQKNPLLSKEAKHTMIETQSVANRKELGMLLKQYEALR